MEFLSWPTSFSSGSPLDFQQFLADDDVTGILGIGPTGTGPATSPLEAAGFSGVTVDIPGTGSPGTGDLVIGSTNLNPGTAIGTEVPLSGAPIPTLYESVGNGTPIAVSDDVDSGGVYGTIPSSLLGSDTTVPSGTVIKVYDSADTSTPLYTYTVETVSGQNNAPAVVSGTSIDSGVEPYLIDPIYINYTADTLTFDVPGSVSS